MSTPKPLLLSQLSMLPPVLTAFNIGDSLDEKSLNSLSRTCSQFRNLFRTTTALADRKKAHELLHCVLNINDDNKKRILALLSTPQPEDILSFILIRVTGKEVYNKKVQDKEGKEKTEIACKNVRAHVSPLEAAMRTGDFHILKILLDKMPSPQKPLAIQQLQAVQASASPSDPTSYLWGLPELRSGYKAYLAPLDALIAKRSWTEIDRLWGLLGEAHKNLPWFQLQVFCHPIPHDPIPDFRIEPRRRCLLWDGSPLDIDSLGSVSCIALYKAACWEAGARVSWRGEARGMLDSLAMDSLCKVLHSELDEIIQLAWAHCESSMTPGASPPVVSLSRYKRA